MIVYTKEKGQNDSYKLNHEDKTVIFDNTEYIVSSSLVLYTETDERLLMNVYNDFKRIFKRDLMYLYRHRKFDGIKFFIRRVLNNRNFVLSITSKNYILSKILYFSFMGRQTYISRPGYSLSFISDLARMKDDFTYPLLFTCNNMSVNNLRKLCQVILGCPFYLTDFHNIFKREVRKYYWGTALEKPLQEIGKYNLHLQSYFDQYMVGFNMANLVERFTSGLKNSSGNNVKIYHDKSYKYDEKVRLELGFSKADIVYKEKISDHFLEMVDDLSSFFHHLVNDCLNDVHNNKPYNNEIFNILSLVFKTVNQENIEFQIPNSTWSTLVGIVDMCNEYVSDFYKQNNMVDNVILAHYTRINEYLRNHFDDKRAFSIYKVRVL